MPQNTRVLRRVGGEPGLNYLCAGLQQFFAHATPHVEHIVADVSRLGECPIPRNELGI